MPVDKVVNLAPNVTVIEETEELPEIEVVLEGEEIEGEEGALVIIKD